MARQGSQKGAVLTATRHSRGNASRPRCLHCRVTFKATRSDAKYCSGRCRKAAARARERATLAAKHGNHGSHSNGLDVANCHHCGAGYWTTNEARRYCSASCRTMAARARREAAVRALAAWQGIDAGKAADLVEIGGMKRAGAALEAGGFRYDESRREWGVPVGAPIEERVRV